MLKCEFQKFLLKVWMVTQRDQSDGLLNQKDTLMMNHYETLFVVKPTLTEEEIKSQIERVKAILEKEGAELVATDDMGMRKLAYPVQKHNRGYYTVLLFKAKGDVIAELERNLRINEEVIKFLTVKYSKTKEIAQFNKLVEAAMKKSQPAEPVKTEAPEEVEIPATAEVPEAAAEAAPEATTEAAAEAPAETETATSTEA
jgi:small subunit ribosomal protein S6